MVTVETSFGSGTLKDLQGLTEKTETTLSDIKDSLDKLIETVTGLSGDNGSFIKDMGNKAEGVVTEGAAGKADKGDNVKANGGKAKASLDVKISDVANIPANFIMGALLINSTLTKMQTTLNKLFSKMASLGGAPGKGATKDAKVPKEPKEKNINAGFDPKQISNLSKSLVELGKAAVILSLVPKAMIKKAAESMSTFINEMVKCANKMGKNAGMLEKFSKGVLNLVESVKKLALVSWLVVLSAVPLALTMVIVKVIMVPMLEAFFRMFKKYSSKSFMNAVKSFTTSVTKIAFAMILFGVVSLIAIVVGKNALNAIKGLLVMVGFMVIISLLGIAAMFAMPALAEFGTFCISLGLGMILFSIAIWLMSKIKVNQKAIENVTFAITYVVKSFAALTATLLIGLKSVAFFALFAVLLFAGLVIFTLSTLLMLASVKILDAIGPKGLQSFFDALTMISTHFMENLVTYLIGLIGVALFAVFSVVLLVALVIFTIDIALMFVDSILYDLIEKDEEGTPLFLKGLGSIGVYMLEHAPIYVEGLVGTLLAIPFAASLAVFALLLAVAVGGLYLVQTITAKLDKPSKLAEMGSKIQQAGVGVMLSFLGLDPSKGLGLKTLIEAGKNAVELTALGVLAVAAVLPMTLFIVSLAAIGEAFVSLSKSMREVDSQTILTVMGGLSMIMDSLKEFAVSMKGTSAETITAIGGLVKDVVSAIDMLVDIVKKLKDGIPDEQIQAATHTMLNICEKLFGTPGQKAEEGQYTLTDTLETIARADLKDLNAEAVGAIKPLMEGIGAMADVVQKVGNKETFSDDVMQTGVANLNRFLELMQDVCDAMQYLITKKPTGETEKRGGLLGAFGLEKAVVKSPLEAINEVVSSGLFDSMSTVFDSLGSIGQQVAKFKPENFEAMVGFLASDSILIMTNQSKSFTEAMENFSKGINFLKSDALSNFRNFIELLCGIDGDSLTKTVDSLAKLGEYSSKFKSTADSFERMEKALSKMAKNESKISKVFNDIKDAAKNASKGDLEKSTTAAVGGTGVSPVEGIYDIIQDWNMFGIPVRAQIDKSTGEISPNDVGNTTGKGARR